MNVTLKKISNLYTDNLTRHGSQSMAVGWKTPESQLLRFDKLSSVIEGHDKPLTINDYGCGYGAFLDYLIKKGIDVSEYNGYDLSPAMLNEARQYLALFKGNLNLLQSAEVSTTADYTFISGTFNVRFEETDAVWDDYIKRTLLSLGEKTRKGLAFNLLTTYVDWKKPDLFYADPLDYFDFCKSKLSANVSLFHDYPLFEWTILVKF